MHRSKITIDLGALRRNARRLREVLGDSELWAVVKADAYGHGAVDVAGAVLAEGATVLCVATMAEALELRRAFPEARFLVMGPTVGEELAAAREARVEVTVSDTDIPEGVRVHLKLDTGMGRWGLSELPEPSV
jgi:alanine racemase